MDKNKILETCNNDMLKTLYEHRENEEGIITSEFVEELKQTQTERKKKYKELETELKNSIKDEEFSCKQQMVFIQLIYIEKLDLKMYVMYIIM